jgi:GMP synthase (glutamine-hydrolysing)
VRPTLAGLAVVETWPECVYQWHREGFDVPYGSELLAEGDIFEVRRFASAAPSRCSFIPKSRTR